MLSGKFEKMAEFYVDLDNKMTTKVCVSHSFSFFSTTELTTTQQDKYDLIMRRITHIVAKDD